ncbi:patatin-like phospholipase family protein [Sphingomonas sp. ID0503]|uniref:patatin-like phospholipase family protein n=1 Tax=Sphingomonas sp. ID0503 TaxID=3399691 RepID=UPI003AFAD10C
MPKFSAAQEFEEWKLKHSRQADALLADEEVRRARRREALGQAGIDTSFPRAGLALSGGGIRSATFSLGLLRELARQGMLHRFDYLSTVSGGSYIGAYYAGLFARRKQPALLGAGDFVGNSSLTPGVADPFTLRTGGARASLEWLRQSGRYLAPSGSGDYWYALGLLSRNWIGLHLVIGASLMLTALVAVAARMLMYGWLAPWIGPVPIKLVLYAPLLLLLIFPVALHVVLAWAYWITKRGVRTPMTTGQVGTVMIAVVGSLIWWSPGSAEYLFPGLTVDQVRRVALAVAVFAGVSLIGLIASGAGIPENVGGEARWDLRRSRLTRPMRYCAIFIVAILAASAADGIGFLLYRNLYSGTGFAIVVPPVVAAVIVPVGRWLLGRLTQISGGPPAPAAGDTGSPPARPSFFTKDRFLALGAAAAAIVLIALVIGMWTVLAYRATWPLIRGTVHLSPGACPLWRSETIDGAVWLGCPAGLDWGAIWMVWLSWVAILAFLSICISRTPAFLNLSGLTSFYAGRLRRAYLGAGNRTRLPEERSVARPTGEGASKTGAPALDRWDDSDDVLLRDYYEIGSAAPLHLINVTLNETRSTGSSIVQRDRRGRNLVVSPEGIYCDGDAYGELYHIPLGIEAQEGQDDHLDDQEKLPLSTWIAISGAAFSTGLGSRTGFPITQLAGLANVRLGYWWRARTGWFSTPTQWDLLREFRGDFSGPYEKFWYLSDGGHYENTAAYELIRRKLPFIVVSDNGMDERFEYEDVANLVRKARIDFDCEIDFLDDDRLDDLFRQQADRRTVFGNLVQISGGQAGERAVAALARLSYNDGTSGTLLLIKPRFSGDGPADLIRYKAMNSAFPQQTTLDQFFDEAQWESYYHLGRLIAQAVFGNGAQQFQPRVGGGWTPSTLSSLF